MEFNTAVESLKSYLNSFTFIPPLELLHFIRHLSFQKIDKGNFFYKQGENFDRIGFVVSGLLYNFYTKDDQTTAVNYFIHEGMPATCYANLLTNTPASFSCKAIETTYLITIQYSDFKNLYQRHHCWDKIGRLNAEKLFIEKEEREYSFTQEGLQRYEYFLKNNQKIMNRVPQYLIASYIGVQPESLSRIRKNFVKKK